MSTDTQNFISKNKIILPIIYACASLIGIWTMAGGSGEVFQTRLVIGSILTFITCILFHFVLKSKLKLCHEKFTLLDFKNRQLFKHKQSIFYLIATALAVFITTYILASGKLGFSSGSSINYFSISSPLTIFIFVFIFNPAIEILFRGYLSPEWGIGNVAFLEALLWASGTLSVASLIIIFIASFGLGKILEKSNLLTTIICRMIIITIILLTFSLNS